MDNNDMVGKIEQMATNAYGRVRESVEQRFDKLVPRGFSQEPVSKHDQTLEYLNTIAKHPDPVQASVDLMGQWAQQYGPERAIDMYKDYVTRNEASLQKLVTQNQSAMPSQIQPMGTTNQNSTSDNNVY